MGVRGLAGRKTCQPIRQCDGGQEAIRIREHTPPKKTVTKNVETNSGFAGKLKVMGGEEAFQKGQLDSE